MSFVVGRGPQEEELIQALALAVQEPQRKLFTLLTWDDTLAKVLQLCYFLYIKGTCGVDITHFIFYC